MKCFLVIAAFFLMAGAKAQTITVGDVKVSVKAESAASAREQALDQAHQIAFQKLMNENFPEREMSLPSQEILKDMVSDFSIDREKTTPTGYTASMTFQFDEPQVMAWTQHLQPGHPNSPSMPFFSSTGAVHHPLKITAFYTTHLDWQHIKKILENFPGVQNFSILTLSPQSANLELTYGGPIDQMKEGLRQSGIFLSQKEKGWSVSLDDRALQSDIIID